MIHRIRTAFGESEITYGGEELGDWQNHPQGVLQDNKARPDIWSVLSSAIFDILRDCEFGNKIMSAISKQIFTLVGFIYVDDCSLLQMGGDPITVLSSIQRLINSWGTFMEVPEGAIQTDKSWWYVIESL